MRSSKKKLSIRRKSLQRQADLFEKRKIQPGSWLRLFESRRFSAFKQVIEMLALSSGAVAVVITALEFSRATEQQTIQNSLMARDALFPKLKVSSLPEYSFPTSKLAQLELEVENISTVPIVLHELSPLIFSCTGEPRMLFRAYDRLNAIPVPSKFSFPKPIIDPRKGINVPSLARDVYKVGVSNISGFSSDDIRKYNFDGTFIIKFRFMVFNKDIWNYREFVSGNSLLIGTPEQDNLAPHERIDPYPPVSETFSYTKVVVFDKGIPRLPEGELCRAGINAVIGR